MGSLPAKPSVNEPLRLGPGRVPKAIVAASCPGGVINTSMLGVDADATRRLPAPTQSRIHLLILEVKRSYPLVARGDRRPNGLPRRARWG